MNKLEQILNSQQKKNIFIIIMYYYYLYKFTIIVKMKQNFQTWIDKYTTFVVQILHLYFEQNSPYIEPPYSASIYFLTNFANHCNSGYQQFFHIKNYKSLRIYTNQDQSMVKISFQLKKKLILIKLLPSVIIQIQNQQQKMRRIAKNLCKSRKYHFNQKKNQYLLSSYPLLQYKYRINNKKCNTLCLPIRNYQKLCFRLKKGISQRIIFGIICVWISITSVSFVQSARDLAQLIPDQSQIYLQLIYITNKQVVIDSLLSITFKK
eukprot:TRINITY_DN3695_c0_g1_i20.p1 TRINITY_DN3695_c0_g1~~TRINITY_DN3695_c0_g1_i20.p1  ORF type:complete len:264 (+),score=-24.37 TRINITY_DN3695_c0_g1_i20:396-1187(+)